MLVYFFEAGDGIRDSCLSRGHGNMYKRQTEFTAMKNAVEMIEALRYKLRMFGVPIDGPTNIFCDNGAVCSNTTRPESTLSKKHHSIAYHRSREAVAAGTARVSKEHTSTNLADLFTKTMAAPKRDDLLDSFTY